MTRYSQLYLERGRPVADSSRFRNRLAGWAVVGWPVDTKKLVAWKAYLTLGITLADAPSIAVEDYELEKFFRKAELRDILDIVTIAAENIGDPERRNGWLDHVKSALQEENLAFRLDDQGIVQPFVDAEFDANRSATLKALAEQRFGEVRADFDQAFRHLRNSEGKQAIRMMFPAVEVAAKVLHPGAMARLMPNEVDRHLLPRLRAKYAGNAPALEAGQRLLEAFKDWIIASQPYRHGQEVQEPAEPPQDFVVAYLSLGAAFLRWMVDLCE